MIFWNFPDSEMVTLILKRFFAEKIPSDFLEATGFSHDTLMNLRKLAKCQKI